MRIAIVDDSRLARLELTEQLNECSNCTLVGEAANVKEAVSLLNSTPVDVVLLDIDLPDGSGFDVLEQVSHPPQVIFVTAFNDYAVKSFEYNALDYLLKPVRQERLQTALQKVSAAQPKLATEQRIFIKDRERCFFIRVEDIYAFEAMGNYTRVHLAQETPAVYRPISQVMERLDEQRFFRASRSWIINTHFIDSLEPTLSGGFSVNLENGLKVDISKRQATEFRRSWSL